MKFGTLGTKTRFHKLPERGKKKSHIIRTLSDMQFHKNSPPTYSILWKLLKYVKYASKRYSKPRGRRTSQHRREAKGTCRIMEK